MNEWIFLFQIFIVVGFVLGAYKLGKEALIAWVSIQALIANLFVLKQVTLFGLEVTASDVFAIGSLLGINFLQEFFSRDEANKATKICFFFMIFFVLVSQLHLYYTPNSFDTAHPSFVTILTPSPRLLIASMSVFFVIQQVDIRLFAYLKRILPKANFAWRAAITLTVSQLLDTILFSIVGLWGIAASLIDIIAMSFLIKMIVIFSFTSTVRWVKT